MVVELRMTTECRAADLLSDLVDGFVPIHEPDAALLVEALVHDIRHHPHRIVRPDREVSPLPMDLLAYAVCASPMAKNHALALSAQFDIVQGVAKTLRCIELEDQRSADRSLCHGRFSVSCGKARSRASELIRSAFCALLQFYDEGAYDGFGAAELDILLNAMKAFPHETVEFGSNALLTICSGTGRAAEERRRMAIEKAVPAALNKHTVPQGASPKEKREWIEIADPLRGFFSLANYMDLASSSSVGRSRS